MKDYTFKKLTEDIAKYIRKSEQMGIDYLDKRRMFEEKIEKDLMGGQEARNQLQELQRTNRDVLEAEQRELVDRLENWKESALAKIKENHQPVTQDGVAELTLLAQLDTTSEELTEYAIKYKDNSLALRMIQKIGKGKNIPFMLPEKKEDKIKSVVSRIKIDLQQHTRPDYANKFPGWSIGEGDITKHQEFIKELEAFD